jgi:hypothetical protein
MVVERISTQFADVTCTPDNARKLVDALHGGTSVTLSADGKTATFTPTAKLGYGEAYIALALAAEALRQAGITGCATPDQWKAALMGGPLAGSISTASSASASSSSNFPGILALRAQGQGWGQIAQTTNVQLGQVVSSAQTSFKLDDKEATLTPTGRPSAGTDTSAASSSDKPGKSDGAPHGKAYGHDKPKTKGKPDKHKGGDQEESVGAGADASRSNR